MQLKASAPGSLMLLGEHAVLHGKQALVCALDKRITVTLAPRSDHRIEMTSQVLVRCPGDSVPCDDDSGSSASSPLRFICHHHKGQNHRDNVPGHYSTHLAALEIKKPFQFVLAALQSFSAQLQQGFDLTIESEFSDKIGFGSSAAVTVATLAVMANWLGVKLSPQELVLRGREVVRQVQGVGSGADIAASVYGGCVSYTTDPISVETFSVLLPLHAIYAGDKTPTAEVIRQVQNRFAADPAAFSVICERIGQCSGMGKQCVQEANWIHLGKIMNAQQESMELLGVSSPLLQGMIQDLRQQPYILGAKISGSGLGDCVIGLGELSADYQCVVDEKILQRIPVSMTLRGVSCEKN